ncbi:MAG TPA: hypothetical protein DD381_08430 [Lentisphaeria bacterium]|nr:MAG: hypothetical protein A2X47_11260 [Lentisphaerae bacterium GWF2_38_69]HBM16348.1 hypothetical protein [Lentisphaeria bacterium]
MEDRFTHESKFGRGGIPKVVRSQIYKRDDYKCIYCGNSFPKDSLTIDHLIPLSAGGLNEMINFVTCCKDCNQKKADKPLNLFSIELNIDIEDLPVYGDPIIDNEKIPIQIRLLRKKLIGKYRKNEIKLSGKTAQKKLEKKFRREFWNTDEGKNLESQFSSLPGHIRVMIPEIQSYAKSEEDFCLLIEMAKSANTRNLINKRLDNFPNLFDFFEKLSNKTNDESLKKRLIQALERYKKKNKKID